MSYRTILSLAATAILTIAGMSIVSTDALARAGARVGVSHARVGVHGVVAHRGVYRGAYVNRGIYRGAYVRPGVAVGVGAAALGAAAAARAYNYNYGYAPTYYDDGGYYQQQPYGYYQQPYGITAPTETGDSSDRARSNTVNGPLASSPGGLLSQLPLGACTV